MKNEQQSPESWWVGEPRQRRAFFSALAVLIESVRSGQILEVRSAGDSFQAVIRSVAGEEELEWVDEGIEGGRLGPEGWWAGLPPQGRKFYQGISRMLGVVGPHGFLEVQRKGDNLQACLVFRLNLRGGRAEVN